MITGTINHIAITVENLSSSMKFYNEFLSLLGFKFKGDWPANPNDNDSYFGGALYGHEKGGSWINLWQKDPSSEVEHYRYNVGLHHVAFHASTVKELEELFIWVKSKGLEVLNEPKDYPRYGENYRSFYFKELNGIKIEIVNHS